LPAGAGISAPDLLQIEAGKRRGSTGVLAAIAKAFGLALDDLVGS
jgi:transcriptional regulator with XRE-family HTH domain